MKSERAADNDSLSLHHQAAADAIHSSELYEKPPVDSEHDPEQAPPAEKADVPPDGGYGWVCVACVALINAHTWGLNSSYGVFLAHYLDTNTYPGATALEFAFVGGLSISMSQIVAPIATIITRTWGTRATLTLGIVLQTAALLGASWSTEMWQLFLSQGLCFGFGMGFQFNASVGIIPQWFDRNRSFANSIGTSGSGFGGLVYSLAANAIIQSMGIGWAFRILAITSASVCTICAILIRDRNKAVGAIQIALDWSLFRRSEYVLTLAWGCFSVIGYVVLLFSLPSYASTIGLTAKQGSIVGAVLNLGQGVGRPIIGLSSDKFGRLNVALLGTFLPAIFIFAIWIPSNNFGVLIFFALIAGSLIGTFWTTVGPVGAEVVGLQRLPSALSIFWPTLIIPSVFAEPIALELRKQEGSIYLNAQVFTGFMFIAATICLWYVRAWKLAELAEAAAEAANGAIDAKKREAEIRNDDEVPHPSALSRVKSGVALSVKSKAAVAKGLWTWAKV